VTSREIDLEEERVFVGFKRAQLPGCAIFVFYGARGWIYKSPKRRRSSGTDDFREKFERERN
jgi:hypothetical protein